MKKVGVKNKRGQPPKPQHEKKDPNSGLRGDQIEWLKDYQASRNLPSLAEATRQAVDWFISAVEARVRGDVSISAMFDDKFSKEVLQQEEN
jgi:hypothetical protein